MSFQLIGSSAVCAMILRTGPKTSYADSNVKAFSPDGAPTFILIKSDVIIRAKIAYSDKANL